MTDESAEIVKKYPNRENNPLGDFAGGQGRIPLAPAPRKELTGKLEERLLERVKGVAKAASQMAGPPAQFLSKEKLGLSL